MANGKIDHLENTVMNHKFENEKLKDKMVDMENRSRRSNLIIKGLPEKDNEKSLECIQAVTEVFKHTMNIQHVIHIGRCHRLGPKTNQAGPRPIIVYFYRFTNRETVWANKAN